ncbi:8-oxo-dGTP pyrophosphatase MutT, NUDIX family [Ruegeria lacuscaerulensis ITI-1157]|nr:8-oxo-dGTP pyrophosphatase MutT, NUDIX family [Ruegeria lacuscaerulensis ITI-1157]
MSSVKNARLAPEIAGAFGALPVMRQAAALCFRLRADGPQTLLISTRGTGRWIIPKGWPIDGLSGSETAAREAWEEAGVSGSCAADSIGHFSFVKRRKDVGQVMCRARVYPLRVTALSDDYPEAGQRRREWFSFEDAADRVSDRDLSALIRSFTIPSG